MKKPALLILTIFSTLTTLSSCSIDCDYCFSDAASPCGLGEYTCDCSDYCYTTKAACEASGDCDGN